MMLCGLWGERTTDKVKLLRQFLVIMAVSFVGEILHAVLPLPIPASIYGLVLMLALLMTGALKLDAVEDAGKFMIEIMPVMFIPAGVGLMESWGELKAVLVPVLVITLVSTIVVMVVSGRVTQAVIRLEKKHKGGDPIPEEDLDKVWVKFFKVDKARTREYGGSGIGLSIVKAIMDSFQQQCGCQNYDNGVAFWFTLEADGKTEEA